MFHVLAVEHTEGHRGFREDVAGRCTYMAQSALARSPRLSSLTAADGKQWVLDRKEATDNRKRILDNLKQLTAALRSAGAGEMRSFEVSSARGTVTNYSCVRLLHGSLTDHYCALGACGDDGYETNKRETCVLV
jgi:hypothetical protein